MLETGEALPLPDAPTLTSVRPLAMSWYARNGRLPYDVQPTVTAPAGWYRFQSPPGMRAMTMCAHGKVQAWINGEDMTIEAADLRADGSREFIAHAKQPSDRTACVAIRIAQERGCYGGAALAEPIRLDCGAGQIALGDWSEIDGLKSYSGGIWYRKTISLSPEQIRGRLTLNLGELVSSAEVHINGTAAGTRVTRPGLMGPVFIRTEGEHAYT